MARSARESGSSHPGCGGRLARLAEYARARRGRYLYSIADVLQRRSEEIARTITLENGKPLAQSRGEVAMTVDHLRWFAGEARRAYGRVVPPRRMGSVTSCSGRRSVSSGPSPPGTSPWSWPCAKCAALAAGCPVVLKPASTTPLSGVMLAEAVAEVGIPPGVFQLVAGRSTEIAAEMLENPLCRKITFTGSTEVGKQLIAGAAG